MICGFFCSDTIYVERSPLEILGVAIFFLFTYTFLSLRKKKKKLAAVNDV